MTPPQLIGICGYKGAGKTTVVHSAIFDPTRLCKPLPVYQMSFMQTVVEMLETMGIPTEITRNKTRWNEPIAILNNKTMRHAVQTLGTEWARGFIGPYVWINITMQHARQTMRQGISVLIDGVRYPEEADAIRAQNGILIAFHRPDLRVDIDHLSERKIAQIQRTCDHRFENFTGEFGRAVLAMRSLLESLARPADKLLDRF